MSTIVTRAGKGSALTWTEGDANITNLNNDKLENIVADTTPQLGGDLDVNNFKITSTNGNDITIDSGNKLYIGDLQWPYMPPNTLNGTVTLVDTNRNPNVLQLSNIGSMSFGSIITFTGSDVAAVGLTVGTEYQVFAIVNGNQIELGLASGGGTITFTPLANPTDFNYSSSVSTVPNNAVLTHTGGMLNWAVASNPAVSLNELSNVNAPAPSDGNILVYNTNSGNWVAEAPSSGGSGPSFAVIRMTGKSSTLGTTYRMGWAIDYDPDNIVNIGNYGSDSLDVLAGGTYMWQIQGKSAFSGIQGWNHYIQPYDGDPWFSNFSYTAANNQIIHAGAIIRTAGGPESHEMRIQNVGTASYNIGANNGNSIIITKLA
jgi:hypothetical protein